MAIRYSKYVVRIEVKFQQKLFSYLEIISHFILRCLPIPICSAIGYFLGRILGPRHKIVNQRLRDNIKYLRPDLNSKQEIDTLVARNWGNYGRVMAEFSVLRRIWRSDRTQVKGLDNLTRAMTSERSIIIMFLHLSNWEIVGPKLKEFMGDRMLQVYQIIEDKTKLYIAEKVRRPYAQYLIPNTPGAAKKIYNKLQAGYTVCLAVDEFMHNQLNIPAFGRPLSSSNNLAFAVRFAQLTNAILCPVYAIRTKGARFLVNIEKPVFFDFTDYNKQKCQDMVAQLNQLIEPIIRQHVDQWYYASALDFTEVRRATK